MARRDRYSLRPFDDSASDRRAQAAFIAESWPENPGARDPERLAWQYRDNPLRVGPLPLWVFNDADRIVGQLGAIPVALQAGAKSLVGAWCADFVVAPEFRNRGIAPLLLREVASHFDLLMVLGTNEFSYALYRKAGWNDLGTVPQFIRLLDARAVLARLVPRSLATALAPPANVILRARDWRRRTPGKEFVVTTIDRFGAEFQALWDQASPEHGWIVRRDPLYLTWKYVGQPGLRYIGFRADGAAGLRGFIVVRTAFDANGRYGIIADILANPADGAVLDALLDRAVAYLRDEGATFVRCYASDPRTQAALSRAGFVKRSSTIRFMLSAPPARTETAGGNTLAAWTLMNGDSDLDRPSLHGDPAPA